MFRPAFTPEEWESFYRSAVCEGLAPFVYLKLCDSAFFPLRLLGEARQNYEDALVYKDFALCCLRDLREKLCGNGRVVVCKGLALCETIYREPLIRPMGDVDLFSPTALLTTPDGSWLTRGFCRSSRTGTWCAGANWFLISMKTCGAPGAWCSEKLWSRKLRRPTCRAPSPRAILFRARICLRHIRRSIA